MDVSIRKTNNFRKSKVIVFDIVMFLNEQNKILLN